MNNYDNIFISANKGDILTANLHYMYINKKYKLNLNFIIKEWTEKVSMGELGSLFLDSIIKPRFAAIMHHEIKFHRIVFKINEKTPYSIKIDYPFLFSRDVIGTLNGTIDFNKMFRLELQKHNAVQTNKINLWGVPTELADLPKIENSIITNSTLINPMENENRTKKKTNELNNAITSLENLFVIPIELKKEVTIQYLLLEKKRGWSLDDSSNCILACTATGHFELKERKKKINNTPKKTIKRKKGNNLKKLK